MRETTGNGPLQTREDALSAKRILPEFLRCFAVFGEPEALFIQIPLPEQPGHFLLGHMGSAGNLIVRIADDLYIYGTCRVNVQRIKRLIGTNIQKNMDQLPLVVIILAVRRNACCPSSPSPSPPIPRLIHRIK